MSNYIHTYLGIIIFKIYPMTLLNNTNGFYFCFQLDFSFEISSSRNVRLWNED